MNNVFVFQGTDHKVGTTQITQSLSEYIADKHPEISVLLIYGDGGRGSEYCPHMRETIDRIRPFLAQSVINTEELKIKAKYKDNLFIIGGKDNPQSGKYLTLDMTEMLIEAVSREFSLVLIDAGSQMFDAVSLGSVFAADKIYLVLNQRESSLSHFEWAGCYYDKLGISFDKYIVNKYDRRNPYELEYISERLCLNKENIFIVRNTGQEYIAEMENKSLYSLKPSKLFIKDLEKIAEDLLIYAGL